MASQERSKRILKSVPEIMSASEFSKRSGKKLLTFFGGIVQDFASFPGREPASLVALRDVGNIKKYAKSLETFTKASELTIITLPNDVTFITPEDERLLLTFQRTDETVRIYGTINFTKVAQILEHDNVGFRLENLCLDDRDECISAPIDTNLEWPIKKKVEQLREGLELLDAATLRLK